MKKTIRQAEREHNEKIAKEIRRLKRKMPKTMKELKKKYPKKSYQEIFGWED